VRLRPRSIRAKLIGIVAAVTVSTLVIGFAVVLVNDVRTFRRDMVEHTSLVARVIAEYSVSDLVFQDQGAALETLSKLAGVPMLEHAHLYDAEGRSFAHWGRAAETEVELASFAPSVRFGEGSLHVVQPVTYEGRTFGTLYLRASTAALETKLLRHVMIMVGLALSLVGLALFATYKLQQIISGPILGLAATARQISETGDHSIRATPQGDDEIAALCASFNDMLEQIHQRQLERDQAVLRTREKSQFLAAMSHELRTPLNSIIGFAEILLSRSDGLEGREKKFLNNIYKSGQHLLGIINDILDLSKVEAGRMEFHPEPVSVPAVIEGVVAVMKGASSKRRVELRVEVPVELPLIVADAVKLKQVFFNLLSNAVKFSPEQSLVRIAARELPAAESPLGEDAVEVSVADRGIGISPEDQRKIFLPFRQASSGVARRFEGTGLGLSLVQTFVDMHGGRVTLDSEQGVGSTFTVVLPRRLARAGAGGQAEGETEVERVLVVGGNRPTMDRIRRELGAGRFETMSAGNPQEAMELVRQLNPAAIIVDIDLPAADGWEVLAELKMYRKSAGAPVVLYSVHAENEVGLLLGLDDYFIKPLGIEKIVTRFDKLARARGTRGTRILLIDEDRAVHDQLESRLVPLGVRVVHALSGDSGVAEATEEPPEVIVLDPMMEDMDGFRTAVRLRSFPKTTGVPLVALTAAELSQEARRKLDRKISTLVQQGEVERQPLPEIVRQLLNRPCR